MADNGVVRVASNFENDFREFNGRPPTAEETKRHLAFDRLAKTSSLDPATVLLIVDAGRSGMTEKALAAICERLERVEQGVDNLAKQKPAVVDVGARSAQLDEIETRQKDHSAQLRTLDALMRLPKESGEGRVTRDIVAAMIAMLLVVASTVVGARFPGPITIVAAAALGWALAMGYVWLRPIIRRR